MIIQYLDEQTEDDIENGWSKYYLEYSLSNMVSYSCLSKVIVNSNEVKFILNETGENVFNLNEIHIKFKFEKVRILELVEIFTKIFNDGEVNLEINIG
ncbi:hypothetical protein MYP_4076 [Sporocytophaga myxococcoides]|uniref:Uncharacterized protein n=1 Tax=Sporocytophaga myxococcoides TaxID=153721 RepID=A0A098LIM8_9BACT|nr:hypothetical protein MYP_4076 [Sporocytophaga myxococcoides]